MLTLIMITRNPISINLNLNLRTLDSESPSFLETQEIPKFPII